MKFTLAIFYRNLDTSGSGECQKIKDVHAFWEAAEERDGTYLLHIYLIISLCPDYVWTFNVHLCLFRNLHTMHISNISLHLVYKVLYRYIFYIEYNINYMQT